MPEHVLLALITKVHAVMEIEVMILSGVTLAVFLSGLDHTNLARKQQIVQHYFSYVNDYTY